MVRLRDALWGIVTVGLCACLFAPDRNVDVEGWRNSPNDIRDAAQILFEQDTVPLFDLEISDSAWNVLQNSVLDEQYVPANLAFGSLKVRNIGVRYKGSYGSLQNCFNSGAIDSTKCPKLSIKLSFDEYQANQRFFGLKKLNLHSMIQDPSKMHDLLAYGAYRSAGIHAPRAFPVRIRFHGEDLGLYMMVEAIDGRFSESRFREGNGNIFKETWPKDTNAERYISKLETNDSLPNVDGMTRFARVLSTGQSVQNWIDFRATLRYLAIDELINNWDGVTTWYCWGDDVSGCNNHNFYWYQESGRDFFHLIPWDMDATFGTSLPWPNRFEWDDSSSGCADYQVYGTNQQLPAACDPLFGQLLAPENKSMRLAEREWVLTNLSTDFITKIERWSSLLQPWVAVDPRNPSRSSWAEEVDRLRGNIALLTEKMKFKAQDRDFVSFRLLAPGPNRFEGISEFEVRSGAIIYTSVGTKVDLGLGVDSLDQSSALKIMFAFRDADSTKPWSSWNTTLLGFAQKPDLRQYARIKFKARADQCRNVRFELPANGTRAAQAGAGWGWSTRICGSWKEYTVNLKSSYQWSSWYQGEKDSLDLALGDPMGLRFIPEVKQLNGFVGPGKIDSGFVEIDDLEWLEQ